MNLRGLLGSFAVFLASVALSPGASSAGTVTLTDVALSGLTLVNDLDVPIGGVSILVVGASGFAFGSAASGPDSAYVTQPFAAYPLDALVVNAPAGFALAGPHQTVVLGTFQVVGGGFATLVQGETEIPDVGPAFAATLYDADLNPIVASNIVSGNTCATFCGNSLIITVPEPGAMVFSALAAGVALAAMTRPRRRVISLPVR